MSFEKSVVDVLKKLDVIEEDIELKAIKETEESEKDKCYLVETTDEQEFKAWDCECTFSEVYILEKFLDDELICYIGKEALSDLTGIELCLLERMELDESSEVQQALLHHISEYSDKERIDWLLKIHDIYEWYLEGMSENNNQDLFVCREEQIYIERL